MCTITTKDGQVHTGTWGKIEDGTWDLIVKEGPVSAKREKPEDPRLENPSKRRTSELNKDSDLTLKFHYYNEDAKVSYLGLSQAQYERDHVMNPGTNDSLYVERLGLSAIHDYYTKNGASIQSVLYGHQIKRDWWR